MFLGLTFVLAHTAHVWVHVSEMSDVKTDNLHLLGIVIDSLFSSYLSVKIGFNWITVILTSPLLTELVCTGKCTYCFPETALM